MQTFTTNVITRTHKVTMFDRSPSLFMAPKQGNKLAIMVHIKAILPSLVVWSTTPSIEPLRSTGSFIAIDIRVGKKTLILKYLHGNHRYRLRKPCSKSATIIPAPRKKPSEANQALQRTLK
ncbi:hypothetical protein Hdeb2414_s0005g00156321 [Helianthus debilis subsp. tardiflorus]